MADFDWTDLDNAHVKPQAAVAIYKDSHQYIVIHERGTHGPDIIIKISKASARDFLDRLSEVVDEVVADG